MSSNKMKQKKGRLILTAIFNILFLNYLFVLSTEK